MVVAAMPDVGALVGAIMLRTSDGALTGAGWVLLALSGVGLIASVVELILPARLVRSPMFSRVQPPVVWARIFSAIMGVIALVFVLLVITAQPGRLV
jgi:hypothetical protein